MRRIQLLFLLALTAPLVAAAAEFTFENDAPGAVPAGFTSLLGGQNTDTGGISADVAIISST